MSVPNKWPALRQRDGFAAIDPLAPCSAKPGTPTKVEVLSARYDAGAPLFVEGDAEHGDDFGMADKELAADVEELDEDDN